MLTHETLLAQAAEAEREANRLWAKIEAARGPSGALIPAECADDAERASDLMRRARALNAEADELRAQAVPIAPQPSRPPEPAAKISGFAPVKPVPPLETAETGAARILSTDSAAPDRALAPHQGLGLGAADTVEGVAARILGSDRVAARPESASEVDATALRIAAA